MGGTACKCNDGKDKDLHEDPNAEAVAAIAAEEAETAPLVQSPILTPELEKSEGEEAPISSTGASDEWARLLGNSHGEDGPLLDDKEKLKDGDGETNGHVDKAEQDAAPAEDEAPREGTGEEGAGTGEGEDSAAESKEEDHSKDGEKPDAAAKKAVKKPKTKSSKPKQAAKKSAESEDAIVHRNSHEVMPDANKLSEEEEEKKKKAEERKPLHTFSESLVTSMGAGAAGTYREGGANLLVLDANDELTTLQGLVKKGDLVSAYEHLGKIKFDSVGGDLLNENLDDVHTKLQAWFLQIAADNISKLPVKGSQKYEAMNGIADLLIRKSADYSRARGMLEKSMKGSAKDSPEHAQAVQLTGSCFVSFTNLGVEQYQKGDFENALKSYEEAKVTIESIGNTKTKEFATLLYNLGNCCKKLDDKERAKAYFLEAKEMYETTGQTDNPKYKELLIAVKQSKRGGGGCCTLQ